MEDCELPTWKRKTQKCFKHQKKPEEALQPAHNLAHIAFKTETLAEKYSNIAAGAEKSSDRSEKTITSLLKWIHINEQAMQRQDRKKSCVI